MTLAGYLAVIRRRAWVLILCLLAAVGGSLLQIHRTTKLYSATSTYFVTLPSTGAGDLGGQNNAVNVTSAFLDSFKQLATKQSTTDAVAASLGVPTYLVAGRISSAVETGTFYIDITATETDPGKARTLADAAAAVVVQEIPKIQVGSKNPASAYVTDRAPLPSAPFQPKPRSTLTLGIILGLVIGLGLIAVITALDTTVRTSDQASSLAGAPMMATIPKRGGRAADRLVAPTEEAEPYRALRTAVSFLNPDRPPATIVVTSSLPDEGKTSVTANLAVAMSEAGESVLLVDADLRRARLSRSLGLPREVGLSNLIMRTASIEDAIHASGKLHVLGVGSTPPNPSVLLGSQAMRTLLDDLSKRYDIILIDAPPVLVVTDAVVLAPHCDATLMVVRHGKTRRGALGEATRRLEAVGVQPVGVIMNAVPKSEADAYYGKYLYVPTSRWRRQPRRA